MSNMNPGSGGLIFNEAPLFEIGEEGREGASLPDIDVPEIEIGSVLPQEMCRENIDGFPELSEVDVARHFTRLSQWNFGLDSGFYPLGSCTMKYNPKINEEASALTGFANIHPYTPEAFSQGALKLMYELSKDLAEISGMDSVSLQPAAGAHGELAGMLIIKSYLESKGEKRHKVLIPDSAHGTNPASCSLVGLDVVQVRSGENGLIDPEIVEREMTDDVAAFMVTNPNTLGLFESNISEIADIVHQKGGLMYCDGANLNAIMGKTRPGDMGIDVLHFNLHKTFSTPHGGGGPGSGPVGVKKELIRFLPGPNVEKVESAYRFVEPPSSIGRLKAFYGNFGVLVKAYTYIRSMGPDGLREATENAVLNANYLKEKLKGEYHLPFDTPCMHECVLSDKFQSADGVTTLDIAKALIDYGFHPPTIYFPLIVKGALMVEPTESEGLHTLDKFIFAMKDIAKRAKERESFKESPKKSKVARLNEAMAARQLKLRWLPPCLST